MSACIKVDTGLFSKITVKSALPDLIGPVVEKVPSTLIAATKDVLEVLDKP